MTNVTSSLEDKHIKKVQLEMTTQLLFKHFILNFQVKYPLKCFSLMRSHPHQHVSSM